MNRNFHSPLFKCALFIGSAALAACTGGNQNNSSSIDNSSSSSTMSSSQPSSDSSSSAMSSVAISSITQSSSIAAISSSSSQVSSPNQASSSSVPPIVDGQSAYEQYLRPVLANEACVYCHADGTSLEQSPLFMHSDVKFAENELLSTGKINFVEPSASRIVQKIASFPLHNCGSTIEACRELANNLEQGIAAWAANNNASTLFAKSTIESRTVKASAAQAPQQAARIRDALLAEYTFLDCPDDTVPDVSGVMPLSPIELHKGAKCIAGEGVYFPENGYAVAPDLAANKIYPKAIYNDAGTATKALTLEAWVRPMGPRGNALTFAQVRETSVLSPTGFTTSLSDQVFSFRRGTRFYGSDANSFPIGKMWHLAFTHNGVGSTTIYINGNPVLNNALDDYDIRGFSPANQLWLGGIQPTASERTFNPWEGTIGYIALHNRAFSQDEVFHQAQLKPTTKQHIFFDIENLTGVAGTAIRFEFNVVEGQVYNFAKPTLITPEPLSIAIKGLQLTINGRSEPLGQSFSDLNAVLKADGQVLSENNSTLLAVDKGLDSDAFSITFDTFGTDTFNREALNYTRPDFKDVNQQAPQGLKVYNRLFATFAALTGVSVADSELTAHFEVAFESLPTSAEFDSLTPTQMISTANLANMFCTKMMASGARNEIYKNFQFNSPVTGSNLDALISDSYNHFARGRKDLIALDAVIEALTPMINTMNSAARDNTAIATAVCSTLLSSPIGIAY